MSHFSHVVALETLEDPHESLHLARADQHQFLLSSIPAVGGCDLERRQGPGLETKTAVRSLYNL